MAHSKAMEQTLEASGLLHSPKHAALVELCRSLALKLDRAGADVSSRDIAAYLSAIKDLNRASLGTPASTKPSALAVLQSRPRATGKSPAPRKKSA